MVDLFSWNKIFLILRVSTFLIIRSKSQLTRLELNASNKLFYNMYNLNFRFLILFSIIYLLLTLIIVVKIANQKNAPIKNLI